MHSIISSISSDVKILKVGFGAHCTSISIIKIRRLRGELVKCQKSRYVSRQVGTMPNMCLELLSQEVECCQGYNFIINVLAGFS